MYMKYQAGADEDIAVAVVKNVSQFENRRIESLPPLQETIDVEGLNKLCEAEPETNLSISFEFSDSHVRIQNRTVIVSPKDMTNNKNKTST